MFGRLLIALRLKKDHEKERLIADNKFLLDLLKDNANKLYEFTGLTADQFKQRMDELKNNPEALLQRDHHRKRREETMIEYQLGQQLEKNHKMSVFYRKGD